ncbi:Ribonuclease Trv [Fusarium oxysporum f. sp. albedinis]|nr:Ribonuclease Trv [Fusarium oxysporum f. sp. albedinis]
MTLFLRVQLLEEIPVYIPYDPRPKLQPVLCHRQRSLRVPEGVIVDICSTHSDSPLCDVRVHFGPTGIIHKTLSLHSKESAISNRSTGIKNLLLYKFRAGMWHYPDCSCSTCQPSATLGSFQRFTTDDDLGDFCRKKKQCESPPMPLVQSRFADPLPYLALLLPILFARRSEVAIPRHSTFTARDTFWDVPTCPW